MSDTTTTLFMEEPDEPRFVVCYIPNAKAVSYLTSCDLEHLDADKMAWGAKGFALRLSAADADHVVEWANRRWRDYEFRVEAVR